MDKSKELDNYIFNYFNDKYCDEMAEVIREFNLKEEQNVQE